VRLLIYCDDERAKEIVGGAIYVASDLLSQVQRTFTPPVTKAPPPLKMPPEFKKLTRLPSAKPFIQYLARRGFDDKGVEFLSERFALHYCTRGAYKGRLIFPICYNKELTTWTGRSIYAAENLRYRTLSADAETADQEGMGQAIGPITQYLLSYDYLIKQKDADTIFLCEGPFDTAKVQALGTQLGVTSTCFFTSMPSVEQIELMHLLLPRFKRRYLLLDRGTMPIALKIMSKLTGLGVTILQLPNSIKDPGEFNDRSFKQFLSSHEIRNFSLEPH
jgi:hypothetical protein